MATTGIKTPICPLMLKPNARPSAAPQTNFNFFVSVKATNCHMENTTEVVSRASILTSLVDSRKPKQEASIKAASFPDESPAGDSSDNVLPSL